MRFKRFDGYGMTTLELSGPDMAMELKLVSRQLPRERRAVVRQFFQQLKPLLKHFDRRVVDHSPGGVRRLRNLERGVDAFSSGKHETLGFEIRMKRLSLGLSQEQFAKQIGIQRSHLSDLERGLCHPRKKLREKLSGLNPTNAPK